MAALWISLICHSEKILERLSITEDPPPPPPCPIFPPKPKLPNESVPFPPDDPPLVVPGPLIVPGLPFDRN